ncbi:MAG: DUF58 domain-containing protein [Deltaproteobacteria bacterium CG_4_9_14_3_um_filter_63_12]|nr:MAG: DUF58 domain-containing protein [Deltaproteobacteria bacterium CG_4_9_14_3_um_filter_63_12]
MAKLKATSARQSELFDETFLKKIEYLYIVSKKIFVGRSRAERKTRKVASGIEFADHRNYTAGDDFRYLDWNVFGRTEKLLLRLFEEEEDLYIYFLVDTSTSMQLGSPRKLDYAKKVAAALAYIGLSNMDRVCIVPFNAQLAGRLPPSRGKGQIFKVFDFLQDLNEGKQTLMYEAFKSFVAQNKRRGIAVVISDFYDPGGYDAALNLLRYQKFETYCIQIYDDLELRPGLRGDIELVDCETGERRSVTVTPKLLDRYRSAHQGFCEALEDYCIKRNMLYFRTPIQMDFDDLILRVFRAGGFIA